MTRVRGTIKVLETYSYRVIYEDDTESSAEVNARGRKEADKTVEESLDDRVRAMVKRIVFVNKKTFRY